MKEIQTIIQSIHWLPSPAGSCLALLADRPDWPEELLLPGLTASEKEVFGRKTAPAARRAHLLGRLAAKAAVGRRWNLDPRSVNISPGPEGRPRAEGPGRLRPEISISHTPGAALAAAADRPVGVDLEKAGRVLAERVWARAFEPEELGLLAAAPPGPFPPALGLWCGREAAAKSWGRGLLNHLRQVRTEAADWPAGRLKMRWLGPEDWRAEVRLMLPGGYLAAVALKTGKTP